MTCIVTANPITSVYFQRDGQRLENSSKFHINEWQVGEYQKMLGATLVDLVAADYGVYECVAENQFGRSTDRITIHGKCFLPNVKCP
jgi:hypothetical protein